MFVPKTRLYNDGQARIWRYIKQIPRPG